MPHRSCRLSLQPLCCVDSNSPAITGRTAERGNGAVHFGRIRKVARPAGTLSCPFVMGCEIEALLPWCLSVQAVLSGTLSRPNGSLPGAAPHHWSTGHVLTQEQNATAQIPVSLVPIPANQPRAQIDP